jgi:monoamine oxidase
VLRLDDELHVVLENSPPGSSCGVLVGFLEAAHARTAAEITGDERRKLVTSTLVKYFGTQAAEQCAICPISTTSLASTGGRPAWGG